MDFRKNQAGLDLSGEWQFAYTEGAPDGDCCTAADIARAGLKLLPCHVPGNFELDLHANGIVGDPFVGMNIAELIWCEKCHVWYTRRFEAADRNGCDAELLFEGLDCFGDVYLNGELIGQTDNMLIEHRFDVTGKLRGENELVVHIRPAVEEAKQFDYPAALTASCDAFEGLYVRKAPHMYGWDIMPRAVSAGIWRPVRLRYLPKERVEQVYLETTHIAGESGPAGLKLYYVTRQAGGASDRYEVLIEGVCGESRFSARAKAAAIGGKVWVHVPSAKLWWPRGRGEQNLYDVAVALLKNGEEIDQVGFTHGIRTVALNRTSTTDAYGRGDFRFRVNGEDVFVTGSNWVPVDAYHSRDAERIPRVLDLVEDVGCNMLRCWGGNVYEDDIFYEICDRKGVLVWQDFAMACEYPPQDAAHQQRIAREARAVVRRLRQHPCIALWAGDNEIDVFLAGSGRDPNQNVMTRQVLPAVLGDEDRTRPYIPSSPYVDEEALRRGWEYVPENHPWGPRDYYKGDYYKNIVCHFASEIGYHGCPSPDSLRRFLSPGKLWPYQDNEEWLLHCTSPVPGVNWFDYRVELMAKQIRELFGVVPGDLDDFAFASQVSQAEAKKFFIEMFRTGMWRRTGIIWWNIMDGWPQLSDAVVDYYFERKLAYSFIRRSQRSVLVAFREPQNWDQELVACNNTRQGTDVEFRVRDIGSGEIVAEGKRTAAPDAVSSLARIPFSTGAKRFYVIEWTDRLGEGRNHYLVGYPPFDLVQYRAWLASAAFS